MILLGAGITADLHKNLTLYGNGKSKPKSPPSYKNSISVLAVTLSILLGYLSYTTMSLNVPTAQTTPDFIELVPTKTVTVGSTQSRIVPENTKNWSLGGTWAQVYNRSGVVSYYLRCSLMAFVYTNATAPQTFMDAKLTVPLAWYTSWAMNGPWGNDIGRWESRNVTISLYEVKQYWPLNGTPSVGVSWADIATNTLNVDRNLVDRVSPNAGSLVFNISRAINDWRNGTWTPANGFLLAMIAPWETTDQSWFAVGSLAYLGIGVNWNLTEVRLIVGLTQVIPEFSVFVGATFLIILVLLIRRGRSSTSGAKGLG